MKKVISFLVATLFSCFVHAELPKDFKIYTGFASTVPMCRAIFDEYDKTYGTTSTLFLKTGATGMIAMLEMLKEPEFSLLCGSGVSESVVNTFVYPGHEDAHKQFVVTNVIAKVGVNFITGPNNPHPTLQSLLKSGTVDRPITVGFHSYGVRMGAYAITKDVPILWVQHKSSLDAIVSLREGQLDLYIDGPILFPLVKDGKLKSLGHIYGLPDAPGPDLKLVYRDLTAYSFITIGTSAANKNSDIEELNKRINKILENPKVKQAIEQSNYIPLMESMSVKQAKDHIDAFRKLPIPMPKN